MPKFYDENHQKAYASFMAQDDTTLGDCERQALFYLLALLPATRTHIKALYDFKTSSIQMTGLQADFQTGSTRALTKLAFTLYNGFYEAVEKDIDSYDLLVKDTDCSDTIYTNKPDSSLYFRKDMYIIERKPFSLLEMFSAMDRNLFPYFYEAINIRFQLVNPL